MTKETQHNTDMLSADGLATLLRLLAVEARARVSRASIDGRTVWIKRYGVETRPLGKRIHAALSPLLPAYLKASPAVPSLIERETRKMHTFRAAGFPVADIVFLNETVLVLSDEAEIVQHQLGRLRSTDEAAHDDLLVGAANALAELHRAGLCHGRPHPRDMFMRDDRYGFIDFEEEPEAVMPLALAQARDVWLLFMQIASQALLPDTKARAFSAYRSITPAGVSDALRGIVHFFSVAALPLHLIPMRLLGKDGQIMLKGTAFLKAALDSACGPAAERDFIAPFGGQDRPRG